MGKSLSNAQSVSPKVSASTGGSALGIVLAYLVGQVPFIADAPAEVQGAIIVLVVAAVTFVTGYFRKDPARF